MPVPAGANVMRCSRCDRDLPPSPRAASHAWLALTFWRELLLRAGTLALVSLAMESFWSAPFGDTPGKRLAAIVAFALGSTWLMRRLRAGVRTSPSSPSA
jgi:hypothetical protein